MTCLFYFPLFQPTHISNHCLSIQINRIQYQIVQEENKIKIHIVGLEAYYSNVRVTHPFLKLVLRA